VISGIMSFLLFLPLFVLFLVLLFLFLCALVIVLNGSLCFTNTYKILYREGFGYCLVRYQFMKEKKYIDNMGGAYHSFSYTYLCGSDYFDSLDEVHEMIKRDKERLAKMNSKVKTVQVVKG